MVLTDAGFRGGNVMYQSGFLPAVYQGTLLRDSEPPIQNLVLPRKSAARSSEPCSTTCTVGTSATLPARPGDSRLEARISNYELAYRMQTAAPELMRLTDETAGSLTAYGVDREPTARFGRMCLLARRMVERGVRFVMLINNDWDGHGECAKNHESNAAHRSADRGLDRGSCTARLAR